MQKLTENSKVLSILAIVGALSLTLTMTACHTVEGAGRDVQSIGSGVEDAADETRPYE